MPTDDWFRRTTWTEADQHAFRERLSRSRKHKKSQYLRIQALHLAESGKPAAALKLLAEVCQTYTDDPFLAMVQLQRANALIALKDHDLAIDAFRQSLDAQRSQPNIRPGTWIEFPWFIVKHNRKRLYEEASRVIAEFEPNGLPLIFPIEKYRYFGSKAILAEFFGERVAATEHARRAIAAAGMKESGLRYHRFLGLVQSVDKRVQSRLIWLAKRSTR